MMNLTEVIYKRQSIRKYNNKILSEESLDSIRNFIDNSKVLNNNIKWSYDIVDSSKIKTLMNWKAPYYIHIYSQKKENYNENNKTFKILDEELVSEKYGIAFKKGNDALRNQVQDTLDEMYADGTVDKIAQKYSDFGIPEGVIKP